MCKHWKEANIRTRFVSRSRAFFRDKKNMGKRVSECSNYSRRLSCRSCRSRRRLEFGRNRMGGGGEEGGGRFLLLDQSIRLTARRYVTYAYVRCSNDCLKFDAISLAEYGGHYINCLQMVNDKCIAYVLGSEPDKRGRKRRLRTKG